MNLTPEEKEVGKQNFQEAMGATLRTSRREFLQNVGIVGGTAAVAGLGATYYGYGPKLDDRLRVGIIGTGDEGGVLIGALNPAYIDVVAIADIRPYSVHRAFHGDRYSPSAQKARPGLLAVYKSEEWAKDQDETKAKEHVKVYGDHNGGYEALLDDKNVEAVIIALPLHLHHPAAVKAMRKGKHVLTEKLMAQTVAQCKELARVADETALVMAVGHQRHYSILYDNAVEQIKQGLIGDIHHIRAQWHRGNLPGSDSWAPPMPESIDKMAEFEARLKELEATDKVARDKYAKEHQLLYELRNMRGELAKATGSKKKDFEALVAQKEAQLRDIEIEDLVAKYGYEEKDLTELSPPRKRTALEELIRWRLWNRTGGGLMAELGSHQLDASSIFVSAQQPGGRKAKPLSVTAVGGRHVFPADRDCDDHVYCTFEFPGRGYYKGDSYEVADPNKKIVVTYSSINGNGYGGYGEVVMGTKGTLILEQEQDAMLFKGSDTATKVDVKSADGKAAMETYATGGGAAVAKAATGTGPVSRGYKEEIEHWAWCIRNPNSGQHPRCTPEVALADAVIALTSNLAIQQQKRIEFDPDWFDYRSPKTPDGTPPREASDVTA